MKRILLIHNKSSRKGSIDLTGVIQRLESAGHAVAYFPVSDPSKSSCLIQSEGAKSDAVLMAGGDGTLYQVAESLLESGLPVGILPMGTANNLARNLHIPLNPLEAAETFLLGCTKTISLGRVNGKLFFNTAHIGMGTDHLLQVHNTMKTKLGKLTFPLILIKTIFNTNPKTMSRNNDMDLSLGPDSREAVLNNLLVALREAAIQYEAAAEVLDNTDHIRTCQELGDMCRVFADRLEHEIREMGYLPKEADADRATLEEMITKLAGQFRMGRDLLLEKAKSIINNVTDRINIAREPDLPEQIRTLLDEMELRLQAAEDNLPSV